MFTKLCGDGATSHVVLATTMWGKVKPGVGEKREVELKTKFWEPMLRLGSKTNRFEDTPDSAWGIIDEAVSGKKQEQDGPLLLQEELVDLNRRLSETEAGKTLYTSLQKLIVEQKEVIRKLREEASHEQNQQLVRELTMQYEELETSLAATFDQLKEMKIPFGRRLRMLFTFSKPRAVSTRFLDYNIFLNESISGRSKSEQEPSLRHRLFSFHSYNTFRCDSVVPF